MHTSFVLSSLLPSLPSSASNPSPAPVAVVNPSPAPQGRGRGRGLPIPAPSVNNLAASSSSPSGNSDSSPAPSVPQAPQLPKLTGPVHPHDHHNPARKVTQTFTSGLGISMTAAELAYRHQQGFGSTPGSSSSATSASSAGFWASKTGSDQKVPGGVSDEARFENVEEEEHQPLGFGGFSAMGKEEEDQRHLKTVFLGGVSPVSTVESIKAAFAAYGSVFVKVLTDKDTGEKKGMAFAEFSDPSIAASVVEQREFLIDGVYVRLDAAKPKKKEAPENFKYASSAQRWELPEEGQKASKKDDDLEKVLFTGVNTGINFDKYDNIPCEVSGENIPEGVPIRQFEAAGLDPLLLENIVLAGYTKPTPVQKYALPVGMAGRDIMACAQTGSGKTAAFLFPMLTQLISRGPYTGPLPELPSDRPSDFKTAYPEAVILAPTRELASQIFEETCKFSYRSFVRPCAVYGGADIGSQQYELEKGCTILVATPGRMEAMVARGSLNLQLVKFLVLDEADRMLDMGFEKQIRFLLEEKGMPRQGVRQTMMFSATFPEAIQQLAADFLHDYVFLTVGRVGSTSENITQRMVYVEERAKEETLMTMLREINQEGLTLVFLKSKVTADALDHKLRHAGFSCGTIHGDLVQWEREEAIRHFKTGQLPILIATDVASRGLDIPAVMNVVNFDMPKDLDDYVHRIGRTGRVGRTGVATTFINHFNWMVAPRLVEFLKTSNQECPDWLERIANGERKYDNNRSGGGRRDGERSGGGGGGGRGGRGGGGGGGFGGRDRRYKDKEPEGYGGANDYSNLGKEGGDGGDRRGRRGGKEKEGGGGALEMKAWDRMALREKRFAGDKIVYANSTVI